MHRVRSLALALGLLAILTSCVGYALVEPGTRTVQGMTVSTDRAWSRWKQGQGELWTLDGIALQSVRFAGGIEDGEPIFEGDTAENVVYRKGMNALELHEVLTSNLAASGLLDIEERTFEPARIAGTDGYRTEFSFTFADGLIRNGLAVMFVAKEELFVVVYSGAREHYFDRGRDAFEHILNSLQVS